MTTRWPMGCNLLAALMLGACEMGLVAPRFTIEVTSISMVHESMIVPIESERFDRPVLRVEFESERALETFEGSQQTHIFACEGERNIAGRAVDEAPGRLAKLSTGLSGKPRYVAWFEPWVYDSFLSLDSDDPNADDWRHVRPPVGSIWRVRDDIMGRGLCFEARVQNIPLHISSIEVPLNIRSVVLEQ